MTVEQIVEIPADHRVFFEFLAPREIPAGKTKVEMKLTPVVEKMTDRRAETAPENAGEGVSPHPNSDALFALFAPIRGTVDIDEIRMERIMAKHFKHLK